ncbi:MAG: spermidine synthase, partial [Clostridia bacterium]
LFFLCLIFGRSTAFAFWEDDLSYEGESVYNYLQVKEDEKRVSLSTNVLFGVQSVMMKEGGLTGMYYDYALAGPVMAGKEAPRILVLGNGSGTFAKQCLDYFPGCTVEGVEIDGRITQLAWDYFAMPEAVQVTEYDGRAFLQAVDERCDVILVDAYQDITIPFQMSSVEFFTLVREHLSEGGVMVVNINMRSDGEGSINQYLCDTIASVFDQVAAVDVPGSTNRELFACCGETPAERLASNAVALNDPALRAMALRVQASLTPYEGGGHILTDDRAPVELLGMRMIDGLIEGELAYYQEVYRRDGLKGILEDFG